MLGMPGWVKVAGRGEYSLVLVSPCALVLFTLSPLIARLQFHIQRVDKNLFWCVLNQIMLGTFKLSDTFTFVLQL